MPGFNILNITATFIMEDNCSLELSNAIEELIEVYNELKLNCE